MLLRMIEHKLKAYICLRKAGCYSGHILRRDVRKIVCKCNEYSKKLLNSIWSVIKQFCAPAEMKTIHTSSHKVQF